MTRPAPRFETALARTSQDRRAAQALRYRVFVAEMGAGGDGVDHTAGIEQDDFDAYASHLLLRDRARPEGDQVVGVYRLMDAQAARAAGQFYSEAEYDLAPLRSSGRTLLEMGRSCVHPDYRDGHALFHLWQGLAAHVRDSGAEILFGVASFHGTDPGALAKPLSLLHYRHLAPAPLRVRARVFEPMDRIPEDRLDRPAALRQMPPLIKAYLRLGGGVGAGAYVDHAFNTTDVCLVVDTAEMSARGRALYAGARV
ncbi:GNAT family N-acetyltransferase [Roseovarius sp. SYSU LYC5161]|uniref:GNAT family N-acetyltransferase n=1 Tax=Roseovarius halophilus (ex Wu et al. 2025) TaxID=3376060 RepID=UPI00399AF79F